MVEFKLEKLEYEYDALEPYIDAETMRIHHFKHHQAYCDNFNLAIKDYPEFENKTAEEILVLSLALGPDHKAKILNNGGGYVNHNFFWSILKKDAEFKGEIADAIVKRFGSFDKFKEDFSTAAKTQFGSGWAWLVLSSGELEIVKTANQDTPILQRKIPLLAIDVWEHAYYLKYQNRRPEYVENFFNVINWSKVNELYLKSRGN